MKISIRADIAGTQNIPFDTENGTSWLDDEHVRACEFLETTDDGWTWAHCPDLGIGQFMSIDLDFEGE
jgi:hypothetical protein